MKIIDLLYEMARPRKEALGKVSSVAIQLGQHLVKLIAVDDCYQGREHWETEVTNLLFSISRIKIKPNNKKISYKEYLFKLYEEDFGDGKDTIIDIFADMQSLKNNGYPIKEITAEEVYKKMQTFYVTICTYMASEQTPMWDKIRTIVRSL